MADNMIMADGCGAAEPQSRNVTTTMAHDDTVAAPSTLEITSRIARYAYEDRLVFAGPVSAGTVGEATVWSIGAMEASLFLVPQP
jgi:hypothetical protein